MKEGPEKNVHNAVAKTFLMSIMKPEIFQKEFENIFEDYTNESSPSGLQIDSELYKKFHALFLLGDSYYFIINHHTSSFEVVSKEVESVLGYSPVEFTISFMNSKIHPDDRTWFLAIGKSIIKFFSDLPKAKAKKYKVRYDIRLLKKDGHYARILYQGVILELDEQGRFITTLGVHTDISYLKYEGRPVLSLIGMDGEPSFIDTASKNGFVSGREDLTEREKEILALLIEGKLSKEIGQILKISKQTVDTHRKNMLHKKHLGNTGELVGKAIRYGWI